MATQTYRSGARVNDAPQSATPTSTAYSTSLRHIAAAIRLSLGWIFLWAFLDKLFGLGCP